MHQLRLHLLLSHDFPLLIQCEQHSSGWCQLAQLGDGVRGLALSLRSTMGPSREEAVQEVCSSMHIAGIFYMFFKHCPLKHQ